MLAGPVVPTSPGKAGCVLALSFFLASTLALGPCAGAGVSPAPGEAAPEAVGEEASSLAEAGASPVTWPTTRGFCWTAGWLAALRCCAILIAPSASAPEMEAGRAADGEAASSVWAGEALSSTAASTSSRTGLLDAVAHVGTIIPTRAGPWTTLHGTSLSAHTWEGLPPYPSRQIWCWDPSAACACLSPWLQDNRDPLLTWHLRLWLAYGVN